MKSTDDYMQRFADDCEKLLEDEDHPSFGLACIISNWVTWIWERPRELAELEPELAEVKFLAWKEQLDLHLWGETAQLGSTLRQLKKDKHETFLSIFEECREKARADLKEQGYERLCPSEGSLPVGSETIVDDSQAQPTGRKELDGRVYKVEPGLAGYRKGERILVPAQAILYEYQPHAAENLSSH